MELNPYLSFDGQCDTAFKFYEKVLGAKILYKMIYGESPMAKDFPPETQKQIMHARLLIGDKVVMGSDAPCGRYQKPQGFHVTLGIETPEQAESIFKALSEGGTVQMPIQETFWAHRFGMLVDQFGTPWMVNCEKAA